MVIDCASEEIAEESKVLLQRIMLKTPLSR